MSDSCEVRVEQHAFREALTGQTLVTEGVGPCIAIALAFGGHGFMAHAADPSNEPAGDQFFDSVEAALPRDVRKAIRPLVIGGCIDPDIPENAEAVRNARDYVLKRLTAAGFGEPHVRWCVPGQWQNMSLVVGTITAEVKTEPYVGGTPSESFRLVDD